MEYEASKYSPNPNHTPPLIPTLIITLTLNRAHYQEAHPTTSMRKCIALHSISTSASTNARAHCS